MEMNELNCKIALRQAELEQKIIKLSKLTKNEKKGESISLLNSFVDLQILHSKAMGVAVQILPNKEVADAYDITACLHRLYRYRGRRNNKDG